MPSDVYTVKELAEKLQIGRKQAYELIHDGEIQYIRINTSIRIPKKAYDQFLSRTTNGEIQTIAGTHEEQIGLLT